MERMVRIGWAILVAVMVFAGSGFAYDTWTSRNPTPHGQSINGIVWTGSQWVEVGSGGVIFTSVDGLAWTPRASGTTSGLYGIVWTGSQYVACGQNGIILTSPDAVTWTARVSGTSNLLRGVAWNGSQYVALGLNGTILTSPDAVTWTARTSGTIEALINVMWNGSQYVAAGFGGVILTSPNGVDWTPRTSNTSNPLYMVAWSGSLYVASGQNGTIVTSPDGATWTVSPHVGAGHLYTVVWTGAQFVATGFGGAVSTSPDGITWTARTSGSSAPLQASAWNGSLFVAAGSQGALLTSADGILWTDHRAQVTLQTLENVVWGNDLFVAVGSGGTVLTSPDAVTWTPRTSGISTSIFQIVRADTQFVVVGNSGKISTSPDGATWTARTSGTPNQLLGLAWSGSKFAAVGASGTVLTSPDGVTWTTQTSGTPNTLYGVAWGAGTFVMVGTGGVVRTSPTGVSWTSRTSNTSEQLNDVVWTGNKFVAVGTTGAILTSPDGVTWTTRTSGTSNNLTGVTWTGSTAVVAGELGTILTSPDGVTWTARLSGAGTTLNGVGANGRRVVAVGFPGIILSAERPLPDVSYATPKLYPSNASISTLTPSNSGTAATSWSISPALHTGLSFNTSTGAVTGTPAGVFPATTFTVIATNSEGADTTTVSIEVQAPPTSLAYASSAAVYSQGFGITMNRPTVGGGPLNTSFDLLSGSLPSGVFLNPANGNIYGTPADTGSFSPQIRVSNAVGSAVATLDLHVKSPTPAVSYSPGSFAYPIGSAISTLAPANAGGIVRSWSIAPDLTANTGLVFNTTNGKISGTPARISTDTDYTVTAQGFGESAVQAIPLVVRITPVPPTVTYANAPVSYPINIAIASLTKTGKSGIITAYSIAPALPAGLRFNTTTGEILGTPTAAVAATDYVVSAVGPGGTGKDTINLATTAAAPTVTYPDDLRNYPVGTEITPLAKTGMTGIISRYSIDPALPEGLAFNPTTGKITGTPTLAVTATDYVVTAQGPGGTGSDTVRIATLVNAPAIAFVADTVRFVRGAEITPFRPGNSGGPVLSWSISSGSNGKTLAAHTGLLFNPTTGKILGTPVYLAAPAAFTVTAHGLSGSQSQAVVVVAVTSPAGKRAIEAPDAANARALVRVGRTINGRTGTAGKYALQKTGPAKIRE